MPTDKQRAASRANGARSRGPVTEEGKAISSQNSLKHGLRARNLILSKEEEQDFDVYVDNLLEEVKPLGQLEFTLFQQMVRAGWELRRIELKLASFTVDPLDNFAAREKYELFHRYHSRLETSYYRAQKELRILQTNRVLQTSLPAPLEHGTLPGLASVVQVAQMAKRTHKQFNSIAINKLIEHSNPGAPPPSEGYIPWHAHLTAQEREKLNL
ncbi:MAG: hypothetical protein FJW20_03635 [Acidimicrobiia bacterium]|nr:hypothetical protein [Acidimicrobiia bacterium]